MMLGFFIILLFIVFRFGPYLFITILSKQMTSKTQQKKDNSTQQEYLQNSLDSLKLSKTLQKQSDSPLNEGSFLPQSMKDKIFVQSQSPSPSMKDSSKNPANYQTPSKLINHKKMKQFDNEAIEEKPEEEEFSFRSKNRRCLDQKKIKKDESSEINYRAHFNSNEKQAFLNRCDQDYNSNQFIPMLQIFSHQEYYGDETQTDIQWPQNVSMQIEVIGHQVSNHQNDVQFTTQASIDNFDDFIKEADFFLWNNNKDLKSVEQFKKVVEKHVVIEPTPYPISSFGELLFKDGLFLVSMMALRILQNKKQGTIYPMLTYFDCLYRQQIASNRFIYHSSLSRYKVQYAKQCSTIIINNTPPQWYSQPQSNPQQPSYPASQTTLDILIMGQQENLKEAQMRRNKYIDQSSDEKTQGFLGINIGSLEFKKQTQKPPKERKKKTGNSALETLIKLSNNLTRKQNNVELRAQWQEEYRL